MAMCFSKDPATGTRSYKSYQSSDLHGLVMYGVVAKADPDRDYDLDSDYAADPYDGAY